MGHALVFPIVQGLAPGDLDYYDCLGALSSEWEGIEWELSLVLAPGETVPEQAGSRSRAKHWNITRGLIAVGPTPESLHRKAFRAKSPKDNPIHSARRYRVRRAAPSAPIEELDAPWVLPASFVTAMLRRGRTNTVIFDPRGLEYLPYLDVDWDDPDITSVALVELDVSSQVLKLFDTRLKAAGLVRSGRLWGEAGSTRMYSRPTNYAERWRDHAQQLRVTLGAAAVLVRENWRRWRRKRNPLDSLRTTVEPWRGNWHVEELLVRSENSSQVTEGSWRVPAEPISELARQAHDRFGVFPLSFSHPLASPLLADPDDILCAITPGFPYQFEDEDEYLRQYRECYLGLTHKKAGWDCFRHVEILSAGAVPLMPDINSIPKFSMIHYPKQGLSETYRRFVVHGEVPDLKTRREFRSYFLGHLTTESMARYLISCAELQEVHSLLFIDEQGPVNPEYLSILTLIGLKQIFGSRCDVAFPVDFVYQDSNLTARASYGRGFGYSRVLSGDLRSTREHSGTEIDPVNSAPKYDAVIFGSVSRNGDLVDRLLIEQPLVKKVLIHGEDMPPSQADLDRLTAVNTTGFVRSIDKER